MIDQKEGETELNVKVHYDDMVSLIIILLFITADFQLHQQLSHIYGCEPTSWEECGTAYGSLDMKEAGCEVFRLWTQEVVKTALLCMLPVQNKLIT
jgi:hypothetical protein